MSQTVVNVQINRDNCKSKQVSSGKVRAGVKSASAVV